MPEVVSCPDCDKKLKVPDTLLGKRVKCPSCGVTFTAESESAPPPAEEEEQRPSSGGGKRRSKAMDELDKIGDRPSRRARDEEEEEEEEERPRRRRSRDDDEEEEDRPRRRRRGRSTAAAAGMTKGPGIALLIVGILGILMGFFYVAQAISGQVGFGMNGPGQGGGDPGPVLWIVAMVSLIWGIVVTLGGVKLMQMQSYASVMVAAIFAMLPCNPCCLLGLPFGIWALVVVNNSDVKRAFE